ncbi:MAG: hypothetical protein ACFFD4_32800, partial [Candidatus Odinarchaeota archaeon]
MADGIGQDVSEKLESASVPAWEYVIARKNGVLIDADLSEWEEWTPLSIRVSNISDNTAEFNIELYFAYNDSHLFGAFFLPHTLGTVRGMELWFFGKEGVYDVVHVNAEANIGVDKAYIHKGTPDADLDIGGKENVRASSVISRTGTTVEFSKDSLAIDDEGWDFNLAVGDSIAVVVNAWVSIHPEENVRPNFSTINSIDFNYIRLSVGYDSSQELLISYPVNIIGTGETFIAPHSFVDEFTGDGEKQETFWSKANTYPISLYSIHSSITPVVKAAEENTTDSIKGEISFIHDDEKLYTFLELDSSKDDNSSTSIFLFYSKNKAFLLKPEEEVLAIVINETATKYCIVSSSEVSFDFEHYGSLGPAAKSISYFEGNERAFDNSSSSDLDCSTDECDDCDDCRVELAQPLVNNLEYGDFSLGPKDTIYLAILVVTESSEENRKYSCMIFEYTSEKYLINPIHIMDTTEDKSTSQISTNQINFPIDFLMICESLLVIVVFR